MELDVFKGDPFQLTTLSKSLSDVAFLPTRLSKPFQDEPITTTAVMIERQGETLALVPATARGAPGMKLTNDRRNARSFTVQHLPVDVDVMADEVQNLKKFGSEGEQETALAWLTRKMVTARRRIDLTLEWQRVGAIKGIVLDADGVTPLVNLFTEFGVTQQNLSFALGTPATKVQLKCLTVKRMIEDALGGLPYTDIRWQCSPEFFDAFVGHDGVQEAWSRYNEGSFLRSDPRGGFRFGEMVFEEYRGKVGSTQFIDAGSAYPVIEGVPDLYLQHWAPADYNETVGTMGLPVYAKMEEKRMGKGYDVEIQSNPLMMCTRPAAQVKITT